ncbi:MAG: CHAD domain-containing protein [Actinomycetales bacterium]
MPANYREVERKYDVADDFLLPSVTDLLGPAGDDGPPYDDVAPGTVELDATYFDTADHRLLHAGLTLRRRTGGSDAGWHLKVPVADSERDEIRATLGRSERTVPLRLRRLVWIHTRDSPLAPVLRLRTVRTTSLVRQNGTVLAEIADDRVVAERLVPSGGDAETVAAPQEWREIEVELVEGGRKVLKGVDKELRRRGAVRSKSRSKLARGLGQRRPGKPQARAEAGPASGKLSASSPAGQVVVAYLAAELDHLSGQDLAVRLDRPDSIHQMRVATRRLRSVLETFEPLVEPGVTQPVEAELKWLADELGQARDAEVMRARVADDVAAEREHHRVTTAVVRRIDRELARAEKAAFAEVVAALDSARYQQLVVALDELVTAPPLTQRAARPAGKELFKPVRAAARRVDRALAAAAQEADEDAHNIALHVVRKKAKRARYAGEALVPAFGAPALAFATAMERLQDLLGEHHDAVVLQQRLEELTAAGEPETVFTLGRLHAAEGRRQVELEDEIAAAAKAATKKSLRAWLG